MKRWPESRTPQTINTLFKSLWFLCPDNKENEVLVAQSGLTPCDPMDYSPPGSSDHGILQERILEWVAISFSRGSSWCRGQSRVSCIAGGFFTIWATREDPTKFCLGNSYNEPYDLNLAFLFPDSWVWFHTRCFSKESETREGQAVGSLIWDWPASIVVPVLL